MPGACFPFPANAPPLLQSFPRSVGFLGLRSAPAQAHSSPALRAFPGHDHTVRKLCIKIPATLNFSKQEGESSEKVAICCRLSKRIIVPPNRNRI